MKKRAVIAVLTILCGALALLSGLLTAFYVFQEAYGSAILQLIGLILTTVGMLAGFHWSVIFETETGGWDVKQDHSDGSVDP